MATILVSSELTKLSSLYFQQLFTGENNIVRLIEVTAVSKCILSTDRERPKSRPEQRSILSRGHLALFSSESRPPPPGFSIYQANTNQKSRPKLETKSSILLLYLFEATLRAITTIGCEEKLAIQLVKMMEDLDAVLVVIVGYCKSGLRCSVIGTDDSKHRQFSTFSEVNQMGVFFCPLYFLSPSLPLSLPNFPSL